MLLYSGDYALPPNSWHGVILCCSTEVTIRTYITESVVGQSTTFMIHSGAFFIASSYYEAAEKV
jgi:hypothetical protein